MSGKILEEYIISHTMCAFPSIHKLIIQYVQLFFSVTFLSVFWFHILKELFYYWRLATCIQISEWSIKVGRKLKFALPFGRYQMKSVNWNLDAYIATLDYRVPPIISSREYFSVFSFFIWIEYRLCFFQFFYSFLLEKNVHE